MSALPPGSWILDAACGIGIDLASLDRRGHHVVGADASEEMLRVARGRVPDIDLVSCRWAELPDRVRGPFAAVLCLGNSLPHLRTSADRVAALTAFASVLDADGVLLVDTQDWAVVHTTGDLHDDDPLVIRRGEEETSRSYDWRVPERFEDPHVLTITLTVSGPTGERTAVHEVVNHPFTQDQLLDEFASAGLQVDEVVSLPGDDRYLVVARAPSRRA